MISQCDPTPRQTNMLVLLSLTVTITTVSSLSGEFCQSHFPRLDCCSGRSDECGINIFNTTCYCDHFCYRSHTTPLTTPVIQHASNPFFLLLLITKLTDKIKFIFSILFILQYRVCRSDNPDCCPDYFSHCAGVEKEEEEEEDEEEEEVLRPMRCEHGELKLSSPSCLYHGTEIPLGHHHRDNCNTCSCQGRLQKYIRKLK